jgi:PEGA domain
MTTGHREQKTEDRSQGQGWTFRLLSPVLGLLFMAGCQSKPAVHPPLAPVAIPAVVPPVAPTPALPPVPPGEAMIEITSEPAGARIIVNDLPVGRAPLRLTFQVTPQGFSVDYVTIKARFVAENVSQVSQTVETEFTPLEKVPAAILFSLQGAQRRMR